MVTRRKHLDMCIQRVIVAILQSSLPRHRVSSAAGRNAAAPLSTGVGTRVRREADELPWERCTDSSVNHGLLCGTVVRARKARYLEREGDILFAGGDRTWKWAGDWARGRGDTWHRGRRRSRQRRRNRGGKARRQGRGKWSGCCSGQRRGRWYGRYRRQGCRKPCRVLKDIASGNAKIVVVWRVQAGEVLPDLVDELERDLGLGAAAADDHLIAPVHETHPVVAFEAVRERSAHLKLAFAHIHKAG